MGTLAPVSRRELVRRLKELGFQGLFSGGKHEFLVRNQLRLTLPNPHQGEIGKELLARILRQATMSREEWESKQ